MTKCTVCNSKMTCIGSIADLHKGVRSLTDLFWCPNDGVITKCEAAGAKITKIPKTIRKFKCPNCMSGRVDAQEDVTSYELNGIDLTSYECFECHQIFYI